MASFEEKVEALRRLRERRLAREETTSCPQQEAETSSDAAPSQQPTEEDCKAAAADEEEGADVLYCLGYCHERGLHGYPQDAERAATFYMSSAQAGHTVAQWRLGEMYEAGQGVPQSDEDAARWYRSAAEAGNSHAQSALALLLEEGRAGAQDGNDMESAFRWHLSAASSGHVLSQYCAAMCLEEGRGTTKDHAAAQRWMEKSAAAGFPPALEAMVSTFDKEGGLLLSKEMQEIKDADGESEKGGSLVEIAERVTEHLRSLERADCEDVAGLALKELLSELPELQDLEMRAAACVA
mmetsp:Transcript_22733/g.53048  ORF Transcript_22733/g.53048 Transcript_22733/m.53048 type:complete len:296 (-) Transcript_22733:25-912(-)